VLHVRSEKIPNTLIQKSKKGFRFSDVQKICEYEPIDENDKKVKDFWLFCYFGNRMNPKDMAHLKYKNIYGEFIHFIRAKTERITRNDPKLITVYFNEDMQGIVERWGNKDMSPNNLIFPIIHLNDDFVRSDLPPQNWTSVN
jgi:integrase/recombinase XerD